MRRAYGIHGKELIVPEFTARWAGGVIRDFGKLGKEWVPYPGDRLYYVGSEHTDGRGSDWYVLDPLRGAPVYLECRREEGKPAVLMIVTRSRMPEWVLEKGRLYR